MFTTTTKMPRFIAKELKELQKITEPITKKVSKYMFWSFPLIAVSVFNLLITLFVIPNDERTLISLLIYAVLGAVGLALHKEVKLQRKEIQKQSADFAMKRVMKSEVVSPAYQNRYVSLIKNEPAMAVQHFIAFLEEEARQDRMKKFTEA